ncbi:MAG: CCA tRNA nucleotidyltransferase [Chloroflexi bacterium]|nr:CCA tRNA nucleotidyltransferase [Chloroflexota bacterium]
MTIFNENDHKVVIPLDEKSYSEQQRQIIYKLTLANVFKYKLYLVGGAVRDAMMGIPVYDIDIAVLGDAVVLASAFAKEATITAHHSFGTATLVCDKITVDLATLRKESYPHPAALPIIEKTDDILEDLKRRDFTINAMAYSLTDNSSLIDPFAGHNDLRDKIIRILHETSFQDDPTRMYRATRYASRLDFTIESKTLELLKRDIDFIKLLSADRIYNELTTALHEKEPEKTLRFWQDLGLLKYILPEVDIEQVATSFKTARQKYDVSPNMYLSLLFWSLNSVEQRLFMKKMNPTRSTMRLLDQCIKLKSILPSIAQCKTNFEIYQFLHDFQDEALNTALSEITVGNQTKQNIEYFKEKLREIKLNINGHTLIDMGMGNGLSMAEVLHKTLQQKLNYGFNDYQDEKEFAKKYAWQRRYLT